MDQISQQSNYKKCIKHSQKKIKFVKVNDVADSQNNHLFYCTTCINKDLAFKGINYLLIQQIIDEGQTNILQKWPPVNDYLILDKLIQSNEVLNSSSSVIHQINQYFTRLKEEFLRKVDLCEKKMINHALELPLGKQSVLQQYQDISQINKLRSLLIDTVKKDSETHSQIYMQFISEIEAKKEQNSELLSKLLEKCNQKDSLVNFEYPNLIKDSIFSFIDQIDFFNVSNNDSNPNKFNNEDLQFTNASKLMKLISNKSNFCSASFLTQIKESLEKINPLLSRMQFEKMHEDDKIPIDFTQLSEQRFELVKDFIEHQTKIEKNQQFVQSVKESFECKHLEKIIESNVCFLNNNLKEQLKQYLIDSYPLLIQVNFTNPTLDNNMFDSFRILSQQEMEDIHFLMQKRKTLVDNSQYQQSQTKEVKEKIQNVLQGFEEVEDILRKYPIFDLMKKKESKEQPLQVKLIKTNWKNGQDIIDICEDKQFSLNKNRGFWLNCVSDNILEKEKKYIFRFSILDNYCETFYIGLMQNSKCDTDYGFYNYLSCRLSHENQKIQYLGGFGIDKHVKGDKLRLSQENEIEMRVWLGGQQLEILDYPYYQYKVALDDTYKNKLIEQNDLKLYLGLYQSGIKIVLTHFIQVDNLPL